MTPFLCADLFGLQDFYPPAISPGFSPSNVFSPGLPSTAATTAAAANAPHKRKETAPASTTNTGMPSAPTHASHFDASSTWRTPHPLHSVRRQLHLPPDEEEEEEEENEVKNRDRAAQPAAPQSPPPSSSVADCPNLRVLALASAEKPRIPSVGVTTTSSSSSVADQDRSPDLSLLADEAWKDEEDHAAMLGSGNGGEEGDHSYLRYTGSGTPGVSRLDKTLSMMSPIQPVLETTADHEDGDHLMAGMSPFLACLYAPSSSSSSARRGGALDTTAVLHPPTASKRKYRMLSSPADDDDEDSDEEEEHAKNRRNVSILSEGGGVGGGSKASPWGSPSSRSHLRLSIR